MAAQRKGDKGSGDIGDLSGCGNVDGSVEKVFSTDVVRWRRALATRDEIAAKLEQGFPAPIVGTLRSRPTGPPSDR